MSWNISKSSINVKCFARVTFFETCSPFYHYHFLNLCQCLIRSTGFRSRVSWTATVSTFHSHYFSYNTIYIPFKFHFQHYYFLVFCCIFIFIGQCSFSIIHFVKEHMCLSLGDKKGTKLHTLLPVFELNNKYVVTKH